MRTEDAKKILDAARTKAAEIDKPVSIAVLDAAGAMVVFERFKDAPPNTAMIAEGKASGSAFTGRDSGVLAQMAKNNPVLTDAIAARLGGRFVALQGAVAVRDASGIAGAIGVSGATSEEDETIARAGVAAFGG